MYGIFVCIYKVRGYQGAHTHFFEGLLLRGLIGSNKISFKKEIRHFKISTNRSLAATIWGHYLARPHNIIIHLKLRSEIMGTFKGQNLKHTYL